MGKTKHGKDSARAKNLARYKDEGRLAINKARKAEKVAEGKKIKSRKTPKTIWMKWSNLLRNTPKTVPYCDAISGHVYWGKDKNDGKVSKRNK